MYTEITSSYLGISSNRWIDGLTNEQHHAMKCISSSSIKYFAAKKSPFTFYKNCILKEKKWVNEDEDEKTKKAFRIGTIAHLAVLEPDKFEKSIIVCDLNQTTNDFKNFRIEVAKNGFPTSRVEKLIVDEDAKLAAQIETLTSQLHYYMELCPVGDPKIDEINGELNILLENQKIIEENKKTSSKKKKTTSKIKDEDYVVKFTKDGGILTEQGQEIFIIKSDEMEMYRAFQTQVEKHPRISFLMQDCIFEQSGIAQDPETGLWLSVRGDARNSRGYFLDPKTIDQELTEQSIENAIASFYYDIQDAHYTYTANLIEPNKYERFFFIMMSKKFPYEIALVQLDSEDRLKAFNNFKEILRKISNYEKSGKWPTLDNKDQKAGMTIKLSSWRRR